MSGKIVSVQQAIAAIPTGACLCTSGFVGTGTPDYLLSGLADSFLTTGTPGQMRLIFAAGQGDGISQGLNRIAHPGLWRQVIGGHWALAPKLGKMALDNQMAAYNLPQGCLSHLIRDIAAGKPGTFSQVGLHSFVDPRYEGGRINQACDEDLVSVMEIEGQEWLFYKAFPIDVAFIRGSYADEKGNISLSREALTLDNLSMAMAARNSGGIVIAQVEEIVAADSLPIRDVKIPAMLVDYIVQSPPDYHQQTYGTAYNPAFAGAVRVPQTAQSPMDLTIRKVIARRAAQELPAQGVINLGIGMPEGVAQIAREQGRLNDFTLTTEAGSVGGIPQSGLDFGAAINVDAILDQNQQFDFYDGGGLDMACLGLAEVDQHGNVNVSRFGNRLAGCGGFINITQNAQKLVFVGTFTAGGLDIALTDGQLQIRQEGKARKFIKAVSQITFNGPYSQTHQQDVLFVTERCVLRLTEAGLALTEIAPGIDLARDILAHMDFTPIIGDVTEMDPVLFTA